MNGLLLAAVTWAAFSLPAASAEDESRYTIEEVTARLQEWQAKIVTLRVHVRTACDPHAKFAIEAGLEGVERIGYDDWIWTDAGRVRHHHWVTYDGRPTTMRTLDADGLPNGWSARYTNGADESSPSQVSSTGAKAAHTKSPNALYGLWRWRPFIDGRLSERFDGWVGTAIERGDLKIAAVTELDGRRCVLLQSVDGEDYWLDPERGFLPVQVETPGVKCVVDEFFEPEPGFYFPKRGRFLHRSDGEVLQAEDWEVTALELNRPIPAGLWDPPAVKTKEPTYSEKLAQATAPTRGRALEYAVYMTTLDFWLERGFLVLAILFLLGILVLWSRKH